MITKTIQAIYKTNLGVKRDEKVLVFTDRITPSEVLHENALCMRERLRDISLLTAEIGKAFTKKISYYEYAATGSHGAEPPEELWGIAFGKQIVSELKMHKLLSPLIKKEVTDKEINIAEAIISKNKRSAVNVVIALSNYSTSHTRFRDFLTRVCGCRYASMPIFEVSMLETSMNVDWKRLSKRTKSIARIVNTAETIEIKTPNGTYITMSKKGRKALSDDGILTKPGSFGNLPSGEVFFAPVEGSAKGRLVLEWAPTRELKSPITLIIEKGIVKEIIGDEPYADLLRAKLNERDENKNIAELGIGTNDKAKRPDNILESEKILGTIHIALGDNSSFGGNIKTPFHQDFVFFKPTVRLIKKDRSETYLIKNGVLMP
ncbi:aminopeptidase [Dissulfurispira thermophila]|nr:aminopeptidase [Dissulfurispira thermophila]